MEVERVGAKTSAKVRCDLIFLLNVHEHLHAPCQLQGGWSAPKHEKMACQAQTEVLTGTNCNDRT